MSPLHVVATLGLTKLLDMLVKAGADVNLVAKHNGDTPLHAAVRRGHLDFVKALLKVLDARERERARPRGLRNRAPTLIARRFSPHAQAGANDEPEMVVRSEFRTSMDDYGEPVKVETPSATNLTPAMLARSLGLMKIAAILPEIKGA